MKKVIVSLLALALSSLHALDLNSLKWTQDYEMLVNLNSSATNSVEGLDVNKNGIRDDVEYYVLSKYKNKPFEKKIFLDAAKKIQTILTLSTDEKQKHDQLDKELIDLYTCRDYMLYRLETPQMDKELKDKLIFKSKVLNTQERLEAYIEHKKVLPFEFESLTPDRLQHDKAACLKEYQNSKKIDLASN